MPTLEKLQLDWASNNCPVCKQRREKSKIAMRKLRGQKPKKKEKK